MACVLPITRNCFDFYSSKYNYFLYLHTYIVLIKCTCFCDDISMFKEGNSWVMLEQWAKRKVEQSGAMCLGVEVGIFSVVLLG